MTVPWPSGLDDDDGISVYADWLLERGDPHGELIALQRRGADCTALLAAHAPTWLGAAYEPVSDGQLELAWQAGFLRTARIRLFHPRAPFDPIALARTVLALPIASFLEALTVEAASFMLEPTALAQLIGDLPCELWLGPPLEATMTIELVRAPDGIVLRGLTDRRFTLPRDRPSYLGRASDCDVVCSIPTLGGFRSARFERGVRGWTLRHNQHGGPFVVNGHEVHDEVALCHGDLIRFVEGLEFRVVAGD
jgi:uncharacterized protein (TIGR02996 family)